MECIRAGVKICGRWHGYSYNIIKLLGHGGTGEVFLAYCVDKRETVAIKFSHIAAALIYEYHALADMESLPMVPRVIELDEWQGYIFLVLEYIKGYNLSRYIGRGRYRYAEVARLAWAMAFLMHKVWEKGYCLADIKPENIMIDAAGCRVVVVDWGSIVEKNHPVREFTPTYDIGSWNVGQRLGTQSYMIFAICMLMVTLIKGKPYNPIDVSIYDVINDIKYTNCSKELKDAIIIGLEGRYRTLLQFAQRIRLVTFKSNDYTYKKIDRIINISLIAASLFTILAIVNWFISV